MWQRCKNIYHLFVAMAANALYWFPAKKLIVIGVTGTDGKTTTVSLIYHILQSAGKKTAMISSNGAMIDGKKYDVGFHVTNPDSLALQRFIKKAEKNNRYLVLEVTSHGLDQNRVFGIPIAVGVLTNVTHEHLDYHKTYKNYMNTKAKLLKHSKVAIINRDDYSYDYLNAKLKSQKCITFGLQSNSDLNPKVFPFKTKLFGEFNKYNILAAVAVCETLGLTDDQIREGIESFTAPVGRQEVVHDNDFKIIIDFAHTPNAFAKLLPELKKQTKGRLIHVFGIAGKRDVSKRPLMGKVAGENDDVIVLTAEDPRGESVEKINKEIGAGIMNYDLRIKNKTLFIVSGRKEAIGFAIKIAKKGDTVLLTGKSHEKSMNYGDGEESWSEHDVVEKALEKK